MTNGAQKPPVGPEHRRRHRKTLTASVLGSIVGVCAIILPAVGYVAAPHALRWVSEAMAGQIADEVSKQIAPTNAAFTVLIESTIAELEDDISVLEFRRDTCQAVGCWTAIDMQQLTNKSRRLRGQREALAAIRLADRALAASNE